MEIANTLLFLLYSSIVISTTLLITILVKYLNSKALHKKSVRDQILIDLAILCGGFMDILASLALARILTGPFHDEDIVSAIFSFLQYWYNIMLACTVSLQLMQVLSIFYAAELSDFTEESLVNFHRLLVTILGISSASLVCFFNGGMCRPTPFSNYILQEYKEADESVQFQVQSFNIAIFVLTIAACQLTIEAKKLLINREEERADQIAALALRQIENATTRLNTQPPRQLGVRFLPLRVNITWQNLRGDEAPALIENSNPALANIETELVEIPISNQNVVLQSSSKEQVTKHLNHIN